MTTFVVDTKTHSLITTLPVGSPAAFSGAPQSLTPDGKFVYTINVNGRSVSVIDTKTHSVIATIQFDASTLPQAIDTSPDGKLVYVTTNQGTVPVLDVKTHSIIATVSIGELPLTSVKFTPDGKLAYVLGFRSSEPGTLSVIDTKTHTVVATLNLPEDSALPLFISFTPDGKLAYINAGTTN
ncbi:cytochrome D1 domain-containing protein [Cytobacillus sp. IB215665]|uniref:cytochrome D1 domain-containing protein n=1 Tax=Cytobacillus sp. IB215665 TaxID=3097357 RepID=UPI002A162747|nr:cytochrome D1 domain-containing protein [Cytobacillus sp. IB215665]MDX8366742.1 cytochrome D1 domain-containing protein [Cytobacillus sp. IB215665]